MTNTDDIFERIIESLNSSRQNSVSLPCNNEDFVAPILDYTSEVFTNPNIEYNNIHLVCCDGEPHMDPNKVPLRRWSRSRSIVSNSLMNCINKQTLSSHRRSSMPSMCDGEGCELTNESCDTLSNPSTEANDRTGLSLHESHNNSNKDGSSRYPSDCKKCNHNSSSDSGVHDASSNSSQTTDAYIDFYSYADMLNSEIAESLHSETKPDTSSYVEDLTCGDIPSRFSTISMDDYVNCIVNEKGT